MAPNSSKVAQIQVFKKKKGVIGESEFDTRVESDTRVLSNLHQHGIKGLDLILIDEISCIHIFLF